MATDVLESARAHVAALGASLGMDGLALDESGMRVLQVGEQPPIHIQADTATQEFVFYAVAGTLPPQPPAGTLLRMLSANRFWRDTGGATLSVDDESPPRVVMARRIGWRGTTPSEFSEAFQDFADYLAHWHGQLGQPAAQPAGSTTEFDALATSGWRRV